jgi:alkaline phosphatase D
MPPKILLGPLVGGLSHNRANIWARTDAPASMHVWLARRPDASDAEWVGVTELYEENGCAGILPLAKLKSNTTYFYAVTLKKKRPPQSNFHAFITFPKPATKQTFSFMFGSCYLPPDEDGGQTFRELRRRITEDQLRFGLMIGDQIYADDTKHNGLGRVAVTLDDYRAVYARHWTTPALRDFMPNLPLFMTLDDHEVDNDWRWKDPARRWAEISIIDRLTRRLKRLPPEERHLPPERVRAALKAYDEHQAVHAPDLLLPFEFDAKGEYIFRPHDPGSLAYTFYFGGAAFFVMDTRTMRVAGKTRSMLGEGQWHVLKEWLKEVNPKYPVKFIVSSCSILHPIWFDIVQDRWSGFRDERERLLEFLAVNEIEGVRILTGDLHSAHAVTAELKSPSGRLIPIAEFCASPFEQESMWISFAYAPARSKWLARQKRRFYYARPNFGVVNVNFDFPGPRVTFTINYNDNGWKKDSLAA